MKPFSNVSFVVKYDILIKILNKIIFKRFYLYFSSVGQKCPSGRRGNILWRNRKSKDINAFCLIMHYIYKYVQITLYGSLKSNCFCFEMQRKTLHFIHEVDTLLLHPVQGCGVGSLFIIDSDSTYFQCTDSSNFKQIDSDSSSEF